MMTDERSAAACRSVDEAIALGSALHARVPGGHAVLELLDRNLRVERNPRNWLVRHDDAPTQALTRDRERLAAVGHDNDFFREMYAARFGRWLAPREASPSGSSFEYFLRRYGSFTWVVDPVAKIDARLQHLGGNVSGGGSLVFDVSVDLGETWNQPALLAEAALGAEGRARIEAWMRDMASNVGKPSDELEQILAQALPFYGSPHGGGLLFDRRSCSASGEHAIFPYDDHDPRLPREPVEPAAIVPFGTWLLERVQRVCGELATHSAARAE